MNKKKSNQASNQYHVEYNKRKYKRMEIVFDKEADKDVIDYLSNQSNRALFIKEAIKEKMKGESK